MALRAPFIMSIVAPTGSGKTHNAAKMIAKFKSGEYPLVHRFDTKDGHQHGDPFHFARVYYIGQKVNDSQDCMHNENVNSILDGGRDPGIGVSIKELQAQAHMTQAKDYGGLVKAPKVGSLIPSYIDEITQGRKKERKNPHILVVIDDSSSYLDGMPDMAREQLKNIFNVESHHGGLSLMFVYQQVPKDKLGGILFSSSHYVMFPIPPSEYVGESSGVSVNDFRTIMHAINGFSKKRLEQFEEIIARDKPNFILFNKMRLIPDRELGQPGTDQEEGQNQDESSVTHKKKK